MTKNERDIVEEQELVEEMKNEINEIEMDEESNEELNTDENNISWNTEFDKLRDTLTRTQADFLNFKQRVERDKEDMIFFLKSDILKKVLPRIDDIQRMIQNTPEEMRTEALYEGIISMETKLLADLDKMGVKPFNSRGLWVDPDKHDVMTTVPGQEEGVIFDEFEKGYNLWDRVLRHAKVVVWAGV